MGFMTISAARGRPTRVDFSFDASDVMRRVFDQSRPEWSYTPELKGRLLLLKDVDAAEAAFKSFFDEARRLVRRSRPKRQKASRR